MKVIWMRIAKRIRWGLKRMSREKKRLLLCSTIALIIGCVLGVYIGTTKGKNEAEKMVATATTQVRQEEQKKLEEAQKEIYGLKEELDENVPELPWNLVLVNDANKMEEGYEPELALLQDESYVDARIVESARQMLADAKKAGMNIIICSSYRSVKRQEQVFNESMRDRLTQGMGYWEAYLNTCQSVAEPGKSEHALGLALDLISNQYTELDERQEGTKEAKWLAENCHKYGFILRYPPEKMNITGIIYEPWHYRYVGVEYATEIMELGVTLEEYLQSYYQPKEE